MINRREFVALTVLGVCAINDVLAEDASEAFDAGPVSDFAADGIFDQFAKPQKFILVRAGSKLTALSAICTHKNCVLKPRDGNLRCPCHGSIFNPAGEVTKGPAKSNLPRYKVTIDAQSHVIVNLSKKLDAGASEGEVEVK